MAEAIITEFSEKGSTRVIQAIDGIRQAALKANKALAPLANIIIRETGGNRAGNSILRVANIATQAIQKAAGLSNIVLNTTGGQQAVNAIQQVGAAAVQARQQVRGLGGVPIALTGGTQAGQQVATLGRQVGILNGNFRSLASTLLLVRSGLAALGLTAVIGQFIELTDAARSLQNLIATSTNDFEGAGTRLKRLGDISNATRSPLEANVELFSRLNLVTKTLGASEEEIFQFVRLTGISLALQGRSAQATSGALLQLSQALGGAVIQAQEFNSLVDGAPALLQAAARGIQGAGGDVRKLRELVLAGNVTNKEFFQAILSQAASLEGPFAKSLSTIGQSFGRLRTNLILFIADLDKATNFSTLLSGAVIALADNLDTLSFALVVAGTALTVSFGPSILGATASGLTRLVGFFTRISTAAPSVIASLRGIGLAFRSLGLILLSNPITASITAIVGIGSAFTIFRDQILLGIDSVTTLGDLFRAVGARIATVFEVILEKAKQFFSFLDAEFGFSKTFGSLLGFLRSFDFSISKSLILLGKFIDTTTTLVGALVKVPLAAAQALPKLLGSLLPFVQNFALAITEAIVNAFSGLRFGTFFSLPEFQITLPRVKTEDALDSLQDFATEAARPFFEGLESNKAAEDFFSGLLTDAQKIRQKALAASQGPNLRQSATGVPRGPFLGANDLKEFRSLEEQLNPILSAQREFAEGARLITFAQLDKLIEKERAVQLFETLRFNLEDSLRPFEAFLKDQREERLLTLGIGDAQEVQTRAFDALLELKRSGIEISEATIGLVTQEIALTVQSNREAGVREDLLGRIDDASRNLIATQKVLAEESTKTALSATQANTALLEAQLQVLDQNQTVQSGILRGLNVLELEFQDTASAVEQAFTGAFRSLEDLLAGFFTRQKISVRDFALQVVEDIQRIIIRQFILKPLIDQIQGAIPKIFEALGVENPLAKATAAVPDISQPSQALIQASQILLPATSLLASGAKELTAAAPLLQSAGVTVTGAGTALTASIPGLAGAGSIIQTAAFSLDQSAKNLAVVAGEVAAAAAALLAASKAAQSGGGGGGGGGSGANFSGAAQQAGTSFLTTFLTSLASSAFAQGGEFTVPGSGAPDSRIAAFRVTPGEKVIIQTPAQQRTAKPDRPIAVTPTSLPGFAEGGSFTVGSSATMINRTINEQIVNRTVTERSSKGKERVLVSVPVTIVTPNPQSFGMSTTQISAELGRAVSVALRRNS